METTNIPYCVNNGSKRARKWAKLSSGGQNLKNRQFWSQFNFWVAVKSYMGSLSRGIIDILSLLETTNIPHTVSKINFLHECFFLIWNSFKNKFPSRMFLPDLKLYAWLYTLRGMQYVQLHHRLCMRVELFLLLFPDLT